MKINAVYDRGGRILAASVSGGDYEGPMPVAGDDEQAAILDVPEDFATATLEGVCRGLCVDTSSRVLVRP